MNKCIKGESCLHCDTDYCRFKDEVAEFKAECERLKKELKNNSDVLIHEIGLKDEYQSDYVFEKLERQKYRQALQEIRNKLDFNKQELEECLHNPIDDEIREIINSVIGGGAEE